MKFLIYGLLILGSATTYAQKPVVYKCVDSSGATSYINTTAVNKNNGCQKTDFGDPDKGSGMLIRNENSNNNGNNKNISNVSIPNTGNIPVIKSDEQRKKDESRFAILNKELQDEQEQLASVQKMLSNIQGSKDTEQMSKLKDMESRHLKNIGALKKELGIKVEASLNLK